VLSIFTMAGTEESSPLLTDISLCKSSMISGAKRFDQDIGDWDVGNVKYTDIREVRRRWRKVKDMVGHPVLHVANVIIILGSTLLSLGLTFFCLCQHPMFFFRATSLDQDHISADGSAREEGFCRCMF